jgi:hypothetical protein
MSPAPRTRASTTSSYAPGVRSAGTDVHALGPVQAFACGRSLPVTVKHNVDPDGKATTNGVVAWKDLVAGADAALHEAGAVIVGRTNTSSMSLRWTFGTPYVTTKEFLLEFALDTLRELPDFEALEDAGLLSKEKRLASSTMQAVAR